jgi:ABC-type polysaccharide/polyol phosphate transport system ATPase subunit
MNLIIASIFSRHRPGAGIMLYDIDRAEPLYVQLLDLGGLPLSMHHARGISLLDDRLYVIVPCALLIFRVQPNGDGPLFALEKTVCRPEWVVGDSAQGDLHAVHASPSKKCLYVSFNAYSAVDVLDLEGEFLERRYLWDLVPSVFPLPNHITGEYFHFGVVRHIFEAPDGELLLTAAMLNGTMESAILSCDSGRMVLGPFSQPLHSGLVFQNRLSFCDIRKAEIPAYQWPIREDEADLNPTQLFKATISDKQWEGMELAVRGITCLNNRLLCGVFCMGRPQKDGYAPRMMEFDLETGTQLNEHLLPSFNELIDPTVYELLQVSPAVEAAMQSWSGHHLYRGHKPLESMWSLSAAGSELIPSASQTGSVISTDPVHETHGEKSILNYDETAASTRPAIIAENVAVKFVRGGSIFDSFSRKKKSKRTFWALKDISFTLFEGDVLGVIGRNGSGKSTLSMVCAGVYLPDKGQIDVSGRVQLLALGTGFRGDMTGRENAIINGSLLGLSRRETQSKMKEIEEFAEIGEFMDEPVRTYSSGMRSRLGFAVATAVKPDILILDEIMSTGDRSFQDKAMRRMQQMRGLARSVIIVSHQPGQVRKLCNKVLWLEKGRTVMFGKTRMVVDSYNEFCFNPDEWLKQHQFN